MTLAVMVGDAVRKEIHRSELSEAEFAQKVGISRQRLTQVLDGESTPRLATLEQWADTLGVSWEFDIVDDQPLTRKALTTLINHAVGKTNHRNQGLCPDGSTRTRDPKCRVCNAVEVVKAAYS